MKIAFPLSSPSELAFEFAKSTHIGIYNTVKNSTYLIPTHTDKLEGETNELATLLLTKQINCVVSPSYEFKTLRKLKNNNIQTLQSQGRNLLQNIQLWANNQLPDFAVSESFIANSCGTTCAECTLPC